MSLPVIADVFRCSFKWTSVAYTRDAVNVMHFHAPGKTAAQVFTALDSNVTAAMWGQTASSQAIDEVDVTPLDGVSPTVINATGSPAKWSGSGSGSDTISQVCVLVKLTTAVRGRQARGRVYLPWVGEATIANGVIAAGSVTSMQAAWTSFISAMSGSGVKLCIASYVHLVENEVILAKVEALAATQRRRQPR